jgi:hypothetical protein
VWLSVDSLPSRAIVQSEGRPQIDDLGACVDIATPGFYRRAGRKGEKHDISVAGVIGMHQFDTGTKKIRMVFFDGRWSTTGRPRDLDVGMIEENAQGLASHVPTRTYYAGFYHLIVVGDVSD